MNNFTAIEQTLSKCSLFKDDMFSHINEAFEDNKPIPNFIAEKNNLNEEDLLNDVVDWLIELNFLRESSPVQKPQGGRPASRRFLVNPRISE